MVEPDARREGLRRKFLSLGLGELAAAVVFVYIALWVVGPKVRDERSMLTFMVALAPLLLILCQAGAYWLLARSWVKVGSMPRPLALLYRVFRVLNVVVILAAGLYIVLNLPDAPVMAVLTVVVWLFAVVEFVNYYVLRLSYPINKWFHQVGRWRTPQLIRDIHASEHLYR
ncbi:hypothetical protein [Lapillicoccus sp.]|uniref:hypothetical protein n=1 Tax=Lapillicoccus sp. TaxID=1909287 RepID=UPI0032670F33